MCGISGLSPAFTLNAAIEIAKPGGKSEITDLSRAISFIQVVHAIKVRWNILDVHPQPIFRITHKQRSTVKHP